MEGPSLVILREELQIFIHQRVLEATGNSKQPKESLRERILDRIDTWGKLLFLTFTSSQSSIPPIITRTHFLMFGSYRINDPRVGGTPRLALRFETGIVYFYSCSIQFSSEPLWNAVDHRLDLMSDKWNAHHVAGLMGKKDDSLLCDLLLDQSVFAGAGNIVKNEVLFNIRRHPLTKLSCIPRKHWPRLARAVRDYCWNFYVWKKKFELKRHWQVYRQGKCPICGTKVIRTNLGKYLRKTFYCSRHQPLHAQVKNLRVFQVLPPKSPAKTEPPIYR
jgi:endonuclease VIII